MSKPYIILQDLSVRRLEDKVCEAVGKGYRPLGGVAAIEAKLRDSTGIEEPKAVVFLQAMVFAPARE
ncbi:MAG: hypothetical protein KA419_10240 [Acidobacteria bacterium]|nr:hypothetical protein [Acidobacteriota bacterium]